MELPPPIPNGLTESIINFKGQEKEDVTIEVEENWDKNNDMYYNQNLKVLLNLFFRKYLILFRFTLLLIYFNKFLRIN